MKRQLLVFGMMGFAAAAARAEEWNKQWQVSGAPDVHIIAGDASITVEIGSSGRVEATLKTKGWTVGDSGVRVIDHQDGNRIDIELKEPHDHFSVGNHSASLRVLVPRELTGQIHTGDGSITLRGLHGMIHADTGDGSISAEQLDGTLQARSGDGSVHIEGRFDSIRVHTGDGSVDLHAAQGSRMKEDWSFESGDGSVRLAFPRNLAADLDARTGDGSIQTNAELTVSGKIGQHEVHGKLNGGGPALAIRTGDGSIQIDTI